MPWRFVGRTQEIERIRAALRSDETGLIMITAEPGMGRTAILSRALEHVDSERDLVIRIEPASAEPLAALRSHLPADLPSGGALDGAVSAAARALAERAADRRLVVAVDDAHLADEASLLALRALSRQGAAVLLATRRAPAPEERRVDPTACLLYEQGMRMVALPPLSREEVAALLSCVVGGPVHPATTEALHAVTDGNPRQLHDLLMGRRLTDSMVLRDGVWRLGEPRRSAPPDGRLDISRLVAAVRLAWRELAVDRVEELCRLALWHGAGTEVAAAWTNVLLLRCRAAEGLRFLDSLPDDVVEGSAELVLGKATMLAFGAGRVDAAGNFLLRATSRGTAARDRLLAYRAWMIAVTGRAAKAAEALHGVEKRDRETAAFVHATRAVIALTHGRGNDAVFHLRRALIAAETSPGLPPWMPPYLTACLIDALLLAGRIGDATTIAKGFHGGEPGSGWEIVVALSVLAAGRRSSRTSPVLAPRTAERPLVGSEAAASA
jgi:hypothetical protein